MHQFFFLLSFYSLLILKIFLRVWRNCCLGHSQMVSFVGQRSDQQLWIVGSSKQVRSDNCNRISIFVVKLEVDVWLKFKTFSLLLSIVTENNGFETFSILYFFFHFVCLVAFSVVSVTFVGLVLAFVAYTVFVVVVKISLNLFDVLIVVLEVEWIDWVVALTYLWLRHLIIGSYRRRLIWIFSQ